MPLISVVMPAYNMESYIGDSIRSVLNQTISDWELIIINDGSTDNSLTVIEPFVTSDSRIKVITQENGGVSVARNHGLKVAAGRYIAFLDADDLYDPRYLELMSQALEQGADMALCKYRELDGEKILSESPVEVSALVDNSLIQHLLTIRNTHANMAFAYRLELLRKYGITFLEGCANGEDRMFVLQASFYSRVAFVPEYLYFYLYRRDSACRAAIDYQKYFAKLDGYLALDHFFAEQAQLRVVVPYYRTYIEREITGIHNDLRRQFWRDLKDKKFTVVKEALNQYQLRYQKPFNAPQKGFKKITNFFKIKIITAHSERLWRLIF